MTIPIKKKSQLIILTDQETVSPTPRPAEGKILRVTKKVPFSHPQLNPSGDSVASNLIH